MKRHLFLFVLVCVALVATAVRAADVYPPAPARHFNDYANVVSSDTAKRLDDQLLKFEADSSNQVLVAIYPKLNSTSSVDDFSIQTFRAWKVGQKNKNNGVVLFVFVQDHKLFIATGYGLEGALPDATCHAIIANEITPRFKANDYDGGLTAGVNAILAATKGEYKGAGRANGAGNALSPLAIILIFIAILIIQFFLRRAGLVTYSPYGRSRGWGGALGGFGAGLGGGGFGGGGGGGGGFSGGGGSTGGGGAGGSW